jgi:pSer/pThr/pTyr-binding forkhead associated (FHA) protein
LLVDSTSLYNRHQDTTGEARVGKLAKFESKAEQWIEGTFGRMFGGRLQPLEVAGALARVMEDEQFTSDSGEHFAPNLYWVYLNPADYDALRESQPDLPVDLARSLIELATRANLRMPDQPIVEIRSDERIPHKQVSVAAQYVPQTTAPIGQTAEIAIEQVNALRQAGDASHTQSFLILDGRRHVSLTKPVVTLGRALDNDVVIDDPRASRHHAQLRLRQGRYVLYDTGSSGGTLVNQQPVSEVVLNAGDVISLAGAQIIFGEDSPTPPPPPVKMDDTLPLGK